MCKYAKYSWFNYVYLHKVSDDGIQKKPGIFISRLLPGGLADSTGLLSVGDEVLEVNNISLEGTFMLFVQV